MINHAWDAIRAAQGRVELQNSARRLAGQGLTFFAVVIAWVFFRATDLPTAFSMLRAMAGINGLNPLTELASQDAAGLDLREAFLVIGMLLGLIWLAPNTQELVDYIPPQSGSGLKNEQHLPCARLRWHPSPHWAVAAGCLLAFSLMSLSKVSEFLYFQF